MSTETQIQWYEVLRHDGRKQYARIHDGKYYLYGEGFGIAMLDAISVTAIDGNPPVVFTPVRVCIDGDDRNHPTWRAIVNKNRRWNGWLCPHIHADDVDDMLRYLTKDYAWITYKRIEEGILITEIHDDNHESLVEPFEHEGQTYYDFGDMGWCFGESNKSKNK